MLCFVLLSNDALVVRLLVPVQSTEMCLTYNPDYQAYLYRFGVANNTESGEIDVITRLNFHPAFISKSAI